MNNEQVEKMVQAAHEESNLHNIVEKYREEHEDRLEEVGSHLYFEAIHKGCNTLDLFIIFRSLHGAVNDALVEMLTGEKGDE